MKRVGRTDKPKEKSILQEKSTSGKGIDIGTAFIKGVKKTGEDIAFRSQRNAFFEIEYSSFTKNILDNSKVKYLIKDSKMYVVGDEAFEFANMFNKDTRRPLSKGIISPVEKEALPMVELLIKNVLGKPNKEGELVYFSVPGEPQDADFNIIYHENILSGFLKNCGYTPKPINEGHAVILSELANEDFTGLGLSFGGGMVNVCLSFMSVPVFKFSVTKAGDWIDQQVAMATDETASHVSAIKESVLDLSKEHYISKIESALSIYYNHLIEYVVENIKQQFVEAKKIPVFKNPVTVILSGGTSSPKGFRDRFKEILANSKVPIPIGEVKMASQPLRSVAKGALVAALVDENKE